MSAKAFLLFIATSLAADIPGMCQFTRYSLYNNSPVFTQVAYPGSHDQTEVWINYRQSRVANYNSPAASLSHPFYNGAGRRFGGMGIGVINESWGSSLYSSTGFIAGFAYALPLSRQHTLSMGLQGGLIVNGLNDSKVTTSSQYELGAYNPALANGEQLSKQKENLPIINAGFLWQWQDINGNPIGHLGVSAVGLNRPEHTMLPTGERLPITYTVSGSMIAWERGAMSIRPTFRYIYQATGLANIGATAHYKLTKVTVAAGAWYKTNKAMALMLQGEHGPLTLAAGFDVITGTMSATVNNAFELSLGWKLKRKIRQPLASKPSDPGPALAVTVKAQPAPASPPTPAKPDTIVMPETTKTITSAVLPFTPEEKQMFDGPLQFALEETNLNPEQEAHINRLSDLMRAHPQYKLSITGHSCTTGGKAVNERISLERAEAVRDIFIKRGIDASRITVAGKDFQEPVASNDTEEGRRKNRRVEMQLDQ